MTGKHKVHLTVEVPGSSLANQKSQGVPKNPTSTMLTSPISASARKSKATNLASKTTRYVRDDFVVSDDDDDDCEEDAFESMKETRSHAQGTPVVDFAGPITTDQRMAGLSDVHHDVVLEFVQKAKVIEEKLRNKVGARRPFFSESNFRDMAIGFTTTSDMMRQIPDINIDRVDVYGKHFIPLIKQFKYSYDEAMGDNREQDQDGDMDTNHQNVIDLVTDDEGVDDEDGAEDEDYDVDDETEAAMQQAEKSRFFEGSNNASFSRNAGHNRAGSNFRGRSKGRGGKRYKPRTSNGSTSGQSTSGVRKKSWPKKSRARKTSGLKFTQSGRGGGGGGMSIGMMPTRDH